MRSAAAAHPRIHLSLLGGLAAALPILSWYNLAIIRAINRGFHMPDTHVRGWIVYAAARLLVFAALVVCILLLPSSRPRGASPNVSLAHNGRPRFDPLLGLRALACLMVVMGHYFYTYLPYAEPQQELPHLLWTMVQSCPWAGVWIFFTLSGYLMGKGFASGRYQFSRDSIYHFYRNRYLRIAPLYLLSVFGVALLTTPALFHLRQCWQLAEMVSFDYFADLPTNPNPALWSISTEVQFYLLVPFLFVVVRSVQTRLGRWFPACLVAVLLLGLAFRWGVALSHPKDFYRYCYLPLFSNLDIFLTGMGLAFLPPPKFASALSQSSVRRVLPGLALAIYVLSAFATAHYIWHADSRIFFAAGQTAACLFASAFILMTQAARPARLPSASPGFAGRAIVRMAELTYAIYVVHSPIFISFLSTLTPSYRVLRTQHISMLYFPVIITLIVLAAEAAYRFVELPFDLHKQLVPSALADAP